MKIKYYQNDIQNQSFIKIIKKDSMFICKDDMEHNLKLGQEFILKYNIENKYETKSFKVKEIIDKSRFTVTEENINLSDNYAYIYNIEEPEFLIDINYEYFPMIMLFSGNIYDIRGLQFFSIIDKDRLVNYKKKKLNDMELNFICIKKQENEYYIRHEFLQFIYEVGKYHKYINSKSFNFTSPYIKKLFYENISLPDIYPIKNESYIFYRNILANYILFNNTIVPIEKIEFFFRIIDFYDIENTMTVNGLLFHNFLNSFLFDSSVIGIEICKDHNYCNCDKKFIKLSKNLILQTLLEVYNNPNLYISQIYNTGLINKKEYYRFYKNDFIFNKNNSKTRAFSLSVFLLNKYNLSKNIINNDDNSVNLSRNNIIKYDCNNDSMYIHKNNYLLYNITQKIISNYVIINRISNKNVDLTFNPKFYYNNYTFEIYQHSDITSSKIEADIKKIGKDIYEFIPKNKDAFSVLKEGVEDNFLNYMEKYVEITNFNVNIIAQIIDIVDNNIIFKTDSMINIWLDKKYFYIFRNLYFEKERCYNLALNIDYSICHDIIADVILEEGYGPITKSFFRNDDNFTIFQIDLHKREFTPNPNILLLFFRKLGFKMTNLHIYNYKFNIIENFESWAKRKTIDKKLITQKNLKIYLEKSLLYINLNIYILNPKYEDILDFIYNQLEYENSLNLKQPLYKQNQAFTGSDVFKNFLRKIKKEKLKNLSDDELIKILELSIFNDIESIKQYLNDLKISEKLNNYQIDFVETEIIILSQEIKKNNKPFKITKENLKKKIKLNLEEIKNEVFDKNKNLQEKFIKLFISEFLHGSDTNYDLNNLKKQLKTNLMGNYHYLINNLYYRFKKLTKNNISYNDMLLDLKIQKKNAEKLLLI